MRGACWRGSTNRIEKRISGDDKIEPTPSAETGGTEVTRFNALKHGVLSRYTVLPWEDAAEYHDLVTALAAEHAPQGPTEEHLVEELAGIFWRKRRLRLAEGAAHRRALEATKSSYGHTVNSALVLIDCSGSSEWVSDAIRATAAETQEDIVDMEQDEAVTRRAALDLLNSKRNDACPERVARIEEERGFQVLAQSKKKGAAAAQEEAEGRALQEAIRLLLRGLPATLFKDRDEFENVLDGWVLGPLQ